MALKFFKTRDVKSPQRGTKKSAGIDFFVPNDLCPKDIEGHNFYIYNEDINLEIVINPGGTIKIPLGVKVRCPDGYSMMFVNKSGIATKQNLMIGASLIDEDYIGIVHLHLYNPTNSINSTGIIKNGMKAAQAILIETNAVKIVGCAFEDELYSNFESDRGEGGFGSTGV